LVAHSDDVVELLARNSVTDFERATMRRDHGLGVRINGLIPLGTVPAL
jgi:hypothetical protein